MKKYPALFALFLFFALAVSGQEKPPEKPSGAGSGKGSGIGTGNEVAAPKAKPFDIAPLKILFKPRPNYTNLARENLSEGSVLLRVTFLASGEIGAISVVSALPHGLTEQAVAAAKQIKFEPEMRDGVPVTVVKTVQFSFSIYFDESDPEVAKKAEILEMPAPVIASEKNKMNFRKIKLNVVLGSDGKASALNFEENTPGYLEEAVREAVAKIKFNPAVHRNGKEINVVREIEYEIQPQN